MFMVAAGTTSGTDRPSGTAEVVVLSAGSTITATGFQLSRRVHGSHAGLLLGVSAGVVFWLIAGCSRPPPEPSPKERRC